METALDIGLANAVIAALLAVLMGCSALIWRKPALTHALGVLVLLKLLTPPMWRVPVGEWFSLRSESGATEKKIVLPQSAESKSIVVLPALRDEGSATTPPSETLVDSVEPPPILPNVTDLPAPPVKVFEQPAPQNWFAAWLKESLPLFGALIWITGSVICGLIITIRIIRFQRLLRLADLAPPELQIRSAGLARRMGVIRAPAVYLVPGAVCPMLWAIGRSSRLLIPCELWDRLGERQRSSLLAHELAHLKRRDHWVRLIEVLASILYWWCPVTWYARRKLREAEEQLCDAWVIWAIPGSGRDYASALLEAVEFVEAAAGVNAARSMPALASGMGQFHQLKRRLVMIKNERVSKKLSLSGWAMVCGLAVLLPLSPSRAQVAPAADPASDKVTATADAVPGTGNLRPPAGESAVIEDLKTRPGPSTGGPFGAGTSTSAPGSSSYSKGPEVDKLYAERDALRAEVNKLWKQIEIDQRRLKELDAATKGYKTWPGATDKPVEAVPPIIPVPESKNKVGKKPGAPDMKEYPKAKPVDPNDARSRDRRLAEVEANLRVLLDEVRALKNESKGDYTPPAKRNFDKDNDETVNPKAGAR